jgi:hypothetical protein
VEVGDSVIQCDGLADQLQGLIIAAEMMSGEAEKVQAVDVRVMDREDLPVQGLGLGRPAGCVQAPRLVECLVDI